MRSFFGPTTIRFSAALISTTYNGALCTDAQATPLADRIKEKAAMPAQDLSVTGDDIAAQTRRYIPLQDELSIITARHKADVLTFRFFRHGQAGLSRQNPDLVLDHVSQRKKNGREVSRGDRIQKVGLILVGIPRLHETVLVAVLYNPGVMACGEIVIPHGACHIKEDAEFEKTVAVDARVGRPSSQIFGDKFFDHSSYPNSGMKSTT